MIKDHKGKTPRFVLIEDPKHKGSPHRRLVLNQFTGKTEPCDKRDENSMRRACRRLKE